MKHLPRMVLAVFLILGWGLYFQGRSDARKVEQAEIYLKDLKNLDDFLQRAVMPTIQYYSCKDSRPVGLEFCPAATITDAGGKGVQIKLQQ